MFFVPDSKFQSLMWCIRSVNGSFELPNGVAFAGDEAPDISSVVCVHAALAVFFHTVFSNAVSF